MDRKAKQKRMTNNILELEDRRRAIKENYQEHEGIHIDVRGRCEEAKESCLNEKCKATDVLQRLATKTISTIMKN